MTHHAPLAITVLLSLLLPLSLPLSASETPRLDGYITDEVGVLVFSDYYLDTYAICQILDEETSSEIAILVVNSTGGREMAEYAIEVFNSNGIGNRERNNGVLIVVATGEGSYFIAIGSGLEPILNDAKVGRFAREYFIPHAEVEDFGYGIFALTVMIAGEIADHYEHGTPHRFPIEGIPLEWPQLIIAALVFFWILVLTRGRYALWIGESLWRFGGGKTGGGGAGGKYR